VLGLLCADGVEFQLQREYRGKAVVLTHRRVSASYEALSMFEKDHGRAIIEWLLQVDAISPIHEAARESLQIGGLKVSPFEALEDIGMGLLIL
jgi:hypothetical protein